MQIMTRSSWQTLNQNLMTRAFDSFASNFKFKFSLQLAGDCLVSTKRLIVDPLEHF